MEKNIIEGSCCGDCAICEAIGDNDPTPCVLRILLKRLNSLNVKVEAIESSIDSMAKDGNQIETEANFVSDET